ncbi:MAG: hypothetical protein ACOX83_08670 [Candidatus Spyradocola sp.]|jgi:hypothetical protein
MKRARKIALLALFACLPLVLTGCLPGIAHYTPESPAGFLNGVVHGWFAPISLILELVGMDVHMFAEVNTGFTYELGFYMAVISGFGGLALCRKRHK